MIDWQTITSQAPLATMVVIVVVLFLRYLEREHRRAERHEVGLLAQLSEIGKDCHEHTLELNTRACSALDKSSEAIGENTKALGVSVEAIRGIERRINGGSR